MANIAPNPNGPRGAPKCTVVDVKIIGGIQPPLKEKTSFDYLQICQLGQPDYEEKAYDSIMLKKRVLKHIESWPNLWNANDPSFQNTRSHRDSWAALGTDIYNETGFILTPDTLSGIWRSARDIFARKVKQIIKRNIPKSQELKFADWPFFQEMAFVREYTEQLIRKNEEKDTDKPKKQTKPYVKMIGPHKKKGRKPRRKNASGEDTSEDDDDEEYEPGPKKVKQEIEDEEQGPSSSLSTSQSSSIFDGQGLTIAEQLQMNIAAFSVKATTKGNGDAQAEEFGLDYDFNEATPSTSTFEPSSAIFDTSSANLIRLAYQAVPKDVKEEPVDEVEQSAKIGVALNGNNVAGKVPDFESPKKPWEIDSEFITKETLRVLSNLYKSGNTKAAIAAKRQILNCIWSFEEGA